MNGKLLPNTFRAAVCGPRGCVNALSTQNTFTKRGCQQCQWCLVFSIQWQVVDPENEN